MGGSGIGTSVGISGSVLIVEDGTVVPHANCYVLVADVDTYFSVLSESTWAGTQTQKEAAIIRGSQYINGHYRPRWKGMRVSYLVQWLDWPRYDVHLAESTSNMPQGYGFYTILPYNVIPQGLKDASCEAALRALLGTLNADTTDGVKSKNIAGAINTVYAGTSGDAVPRYRIIDELLSPYIRSGQDLTRG